MAEPPVTEADVAVLVLQYLTDNGFGRAAAAFQRDAKSLFTSLPAAPPRVKPLADVLAEYVTLVTGARARANLAAAHPALAAVLTAIDGAAGAPPVPEDVYGLRHAEPAAAQAEAHQEHHHHHHEDDHAATALRSPRRALRKRQPSRYVPPPPPPPDHGVPPPWPRAASMHLDGAASVDLLDAPLSVDAVLALLADESAAQQLAASLAPRVAAVVESDGGVAAAQLLADPEVATLLQPLVGGPPQPRRRPAMPPPPPRPSRLGRRESGGGGDAAAAAQGTADVDDDRLEAFLGGFSYD